MKWEVRALVALCCLLAAGCPNGAGVTCPNGQAYCNGVCLSVINDIHNCGSCNKTCSAELACINGACACPGSLTACNSTCIDTKVDSNNCGGCGNACGPGQVCAAGKCALTCGNNLTQCSGLCVDTISNPINCGTCNNVCGPNNFCVGGKCVFGCPAPLTQCQTTDANNNTVTTCVDTSIDVNNCGGCGNLCLSGDMAVGLICCSGMCIAPDSTDHCGGCAGCPPNTECFADGAFFCFSEGGP